MSPARLTLTLCSAQVLSMVGAFVYPALLPTFVTTWDLSKTQAGWIAGIHFVALAVVAPPVTALTDRVDARLVHFVGLLLTAVSSAGFALLADGFWSALVFRALGGAAMAITYLPGLRALVDRYQGSRPTRAMSFYTASFSLGTALSYFAAGATGAALGWRGAYGVAAAAALLAAAVPILALRPEKPESAQEPSRLLDPRPVLANRPAMAFILAYGVHCWELFAMRSWLVAFLAFNLGRQPGAAWGWLSPTAAATLGALAAMAASVGGNELCVRFGRRRVIAVAMCASAATAAGIGFTAELSYALVVLLSLLWSVLIQLDSAALTAGVVQAASPGRRGATLAVHSFAGFGAAGLGPLVLGMVLDATGGGLSATSWGLGFASLAAVGLLGPVFIAIGGVRTGPRRIDG